MEVSDSSSGEDPELLLEATNERIQTAEASDSLTVELLETAVVDIKRCLEMDPNSQEARFALVYVYGHMNKYDEAMEELETIRRMGQIDERWEAMKQELEAMMFEDAEEVEPVELPTIEKLFEGGQIAPKFLSALTEAFNRFDFDGDGCLSDAELNEFHLVVNEAPIERETIEFLHSHFEATETGLTLDGFISFYVAQTTGDAEETWKDLGRLGYSKDLTLSSTSASEPK